MFVQVTAKNVGGVFFEIQCIGYISEMAKHKYMVTTEHSLKDHSKSDL